MIGHVRQHLAAERAAGVPDLEGAAGFADLQLVVVGVAHGRSTDRLITSVPFDSLNEDFVQAGGGVAWNATDQLKVGLEARMFVNGRNTLDRRTVTLGLTYDIH